VQFIAQNSAPLSGDDVEMFERFMGMLENLDDVQTIYHNVG
jgi:transcriptional/translational regulatory protein YebC/TACO1